MTAMTASSTEEDCSHNLSASRIPIMSVINLFWKIRTCQCGEYHRRTCQDIYSLAISETALHPYLPRPA